MKPEANAAIGCQYFQIRNAATTAIAMTTVLFMAVYFVKP